MTTFRRLLRRFTHAADTVRLHAHEHAEGRQQLIELMARTPLGVDAGLGFGPVRFTLWSARWFRPALATACLAALVGVGTVTAAEQALPGDPLYDLKINVTEELRGWLAVTPEAKTQLALARSQRRLEEAARLAASQRLDSRTRGLVEARLAVQSRQTRDELARLQAHGQVEAAARLGSRYEAVLKANEQLQQSIAVTVRAHGEERERTLLRPVIDQLRQERAAAAQARGEAEALVADASREQARAAAERERKAAESALAVARVRLQRCRSHAGPIAVAGMEAQLTQARQAVDDGDETYDLGAYGAAFARFQAAERTATGASLLLNAHEQLPVQVPLRLGEQGKASESEERPSEGTRQREDAGPTPTEAVKPGLRPPDAGLDRDRGPRRPRGGGGEIRGQEGP